MKITNIQSGLKTKVNLGSLKEGDVFILDDFFYLLFDANNNGNDNNDDELYGAVGLAGEGLSCIPVNAMVIPVDGEFIVK